MKKNVLHQLKTDGTLLDGMSYVLECDDGSTVVIDGGMDADAEILLEHLKKISGKEVPVIDMWFLTHAHPDHTFCCKAMGERHSKEVKVKKLYYEFPSMEFKKKRDPGTVRECEMFQEAVANFEGVEHLSSKRGDRFKFGSVEIEVLFSFSDLPSLELVPTQSTNDTSTVLRVSCEGQKIIFLGDVQAAADRVLIDLYGKELKSDVCQVAHHGSIHASTSEFYDYVDPSILLWPVRADRMAVQLQKGKESRHLAGEMNVRDIYLSGHQTFSLELPVKARENPFLPELPPVYIKEMKPRLSIKKAKNIPEKVDCLSKLWEELEFLPLDGMSRIFGERPNAQYKLLWDENGLYLMTKVDRPCYFAPETISSGMTDCVRVYITEKPYTGFWDFWDECSDKGNYNNVKFYPEEKIFPDGKRNTNLPEKCIAHSIVGEGFWIACAYLKFDFSHSQGDIIGLNFEVNGVNSSKTQRIFHFNLGDKRDGDCSFTKRMSDLVFVELVK